MSADAVTRPRVSTWLEDHDGIEGLEALEATHKVYFARHEPEGAGPLVLLCYNSVRSPRDVPMVNQCRGLIVREGSWEPVCWGMERFVNDTHGGEAAAALEPPLRVEEKVDGTLVHLYVTGDRWRAATRHTFCDLDVLYRDLILEACGLESLDALARASGLDPAYTWCLEVCSPRNRVVRPYPRPTVYLLAGYHTTARTAVADGELDALARASDGLLQRPQMWPDVASVDEATALLELLAQSDPLFEGLVIKDRRGRRLKLKSDRYLLIHRLKYRGWLRLTPRLLVPCIVRGEDRALLDALAGLRDDLHEFERRRDAWAARVERELDAMEALWAKLPRDNRRAAAELVQADETCAVGNLLLRHYGRPLETREAFRDLLSLSIDRAVHRIFPDGQAEDPCAGIDTEHAPRYCPAPDGELDPGVATTPPRRGPCGWEVMCWCGAPMELIRGKVDRLAPRRCHCGGQFGVLKYAVGTLLWECSRTGCGCTHEAHPRERSWPGEGVVYEGGQPLGLPASHACKGLRLQLHEHMAELRKARGLDRNGVYEWLSTTLGRPRAQTHVALLDAPTCVRAIRAIADERAQG